MNDETESPVPASVTSETALRNHTETQRSLQHASAALEAAYRRIRQVRRNLLEVADRMPSSESQLRSSEHNTVGPDHNAIVLTGPFVDDSSNFEDELVFAHPSAVTRPVSNPYATGRFRDLPPLNTFGPVNPTPPNMQNSPYFSHRPYPLPRRSQPENPVPRRRDVHIDDASTSLGRRVAAREAAGASNTNHLSTVNSLARFDGSSSRLLASIERDIEQFRTVAQLVRQRGTEPAPAMVPDNVAASSTRPTQTADVNAARRTVLSPNASTGADASLLASSHPESRRRRLGRGTASARPSVSTASERLSLLSNFSVQNLPTPVSANHRPLIFEEPSSYIQAANFIESRHDTWEDLIEEHEQRNYVIRSRYNADGEEHVHPINLDWIDEAPYGLPNISRLRESVQNARGEPRRRGWARLDADGNEIPSDEEEELERIRAEYRIQAQSRSRGPISTRDGGDRSGFHPLQATTTSTSLSPDEENTITESIPRVRLNARDQRPFYGSVMDSVITVDCLRREESLPSYATPFCANPLPMPIQEMVWSPPKRKASRVVTIPKHASFAGR
ncbi:hypothetical protein FPV67DRAFT_1673823 [Lyophyllum atratum]|nr:hypothetical protein FPV67DRAFT_1673823 [Lyophyllum atratum]